MQSKKLDFWKRLYFSMTDFRIYPFIIKEKFSKAFFYFLKLMLILGAIISIFVTQKVLQIVPSILNVYYDEMPEFTITDGTMIASDKVSKKINKNFSLIVDADNPFSTINYTLKFNEDILSENNIIINSDKASLVRKTSDGFVSLSDISYENIPDTNKSQIGENVKEVINSYQNRIVFWVITTFILFISLSAGSFFNMVFFLFSALIINTIFVNKIKFADYIKVILYSNSLASILQVITMIYLGNVSESISFILVMITTVYLFYAFRAIKIDALISSGKGNTPEERIQNALDNAQKELERKIEAQMEEIEKKAKDDQILERAELNKKLIEKKEALDQAQKEYDEILKKINKKDIFEENSNEDKK